MKHCICTIPLIALAAMLAPTAASAQSGWKLPKVKSQQGDRVFTSVASRCGTTRFGVYRFKNSARVRGRRGSVIFSVRLTRDGRGHRPRLRGFRGNLPKRLRRRTREVMRRARFRYRPGDPPRVESVWPDGRLQASRPFNPVRARPRRCR